MAEQLEQILFGVFKGMGDLLWATTAIRAELSRGAEVHLLIFPNPLLIELCSLVDLGPQRHNLHLHAVPTHWRDVPRFVAHLRGLTPSVVLISPHAPVADSSWRVPLALRLLQAFYWRGALLVGAQDERFAGLFGRRLDLDRTLPLSSREWAAYRLFRNAHELPSSALPQFLPEITDLRSRPAVFDLLIHPGAGARNRIWDVEKYPPLLAALPASWKIAVLALPDEIQALSAVLPADRHIQFIPIQDSLRSSLEALCSARLLLVMNSGTMHFAEVLGIPAIALFGQQDPSHVIERGHVESIYQKTVACQPCGRNTCSQPRVYCLTNLDPQVVANRLCLRYQALAGPPPASISSTVTQIETR